eukprot:gene10059-1815_t
MTYCSDNYRKPMPLTLTLAIAIQRTSSGRPPSFPGELTSVLGCGFALLVRSVCSHPCADPNSYPLALDITEQRSRHNATTATPRLRAFAPHSHLCFLHLCTFSPLPSTVDDEFKLHPAQPFVRFLPEYKLWRKVSSAIVVAMAATLIPILDIPVLWQILVMYAAVLFFLSMRTRITHMMKFCEDPTIPVFLSTCWDLDLILYALHNRFHDSVYPGHDMGSGTGSTSAAQ